MAPEPSPVLGHLHRETSMVLGHRMPGTMSARARGYMLVAAFRHSLLGLACIIVPQGFRSETYNGVKDLILLPPDTAIAGWGGLFLATGIFCAVAAFIGQEGEARWALLASVLTTSLWAAAFAAYVIGVWCDTGDLINPSGPIVWAALVFKDLTMLRSPLRTPLEDYLRLRVAEVEVEADGR